MKPGAHEYPSEGRGRDASAHRAGDVGADRRIPACFREAWRDEAESARAERVADRVLARLARRRRRQRVAWTAAAALAVAALAAAALVEWDAGREPGVGTPVAGLQDVPDGGDSHETRPAARPFGRTVRRSLAWLRGRVRDIDADPDALRRRALSCLAARAERHFEREVERAARGAYSPRLEAHVLRLLLEGSPLDAERFFRRVVHRHLRVGSGHELEVFLARGLRSMPERAAAALAAGAGCARNDRFVLAAARAGARGAWTLLERGLRARGARPELLAAAGALGDERALQYIRRWTDLPDERGAAALAAAAGIPGERSLRLLVRALRRTEALPRVLLPGRREHIVRLLRSRSEEAVEQLRRRIAEGAADAFTLGALARVAPEQAAGTFAGLLRTSRPSLRSRVCGALVRLGTNAAAQVLVGALDEADLRRSARRSLAALCGRDLGPDPRAWRRWLEGRTERGTERTS